MRPPPRSNRKPPAKLRGSDAHRVSKKPPTRTKKTAAVKRENSPALEPESTPTPQPETTSLLEAQDRPHTLASLPVEIWNRIGTFLALSDLAAMALSCHRALTIIGTEVLVTLRNPEYHVERLKLLFRLAALFPDHYLCSRCVMYHSTSTRYQNYTPPGLRVHSDRTLAYCTVFDAMTKYQENNTPVSSLNFIDRSHGKPGRWRAYFQAGVHEDRLYFHTVNELAITVTIQQASEHNLLISLLPTCQHLDCPPALAAEVRKAITDTPMPWETEKLYSYNSPIYRCPYCPSEYMVVVREYDNETRMEREGCRFGLQVTRCSDIGKLLSPHSREWSTLTHARPAGTTSSVPFDVEGRNAISQRCGSATGIHGTFSNVVVLPLTDS